MEDYKSQHLGEQMDALWGKAGTALQPEDVLEGDGISVEVFEGKVTVSAEVNKDYVDAETERATQAEAELSERIDAVSHPYLSLERLHPYLYRVTFDSLPEDNGGDNPVIGGCSSYVANGKLYRNLDWGYDNTAEFRVITKDFEGMSFITGLNDGALDERVAQLPYRVCDGENNYGIKVSTHVLFNDWSWTGTGDKSINITRLPFLVLSRVKSMATLESDLGGVLNNLYAPDGLLAMGYLIQFVVTDGQATYAIIPPTSEGESYEVMDITDCPKLTNFRPVGRATVSRTDADMQDRPTGVERYNMMPCPLESLRFTLAYEEPDRLSEFIGLRGTDKESTDAQLEAIYNEARALYLDRERDGQTWQTMHSVIYGDKMESLFIQENWEDDLIGDVTAERARAIAAEAELRTSINAEVTRATGVEQGLSERVSDIEAKEDGWDAKQEAIEDLETIREGASKGMTALQSVPSTYRTAASQDAIDNAIKGRLTAIEDKEAGWDAKADLDDIPAIADNVTSTDADKTLSAKQGKLLNDRINNIATRGRFLSLWDCTTGLPLTNPSGYPYEYHTGDFFIVNKTGDTNYVPNGGSYTGVPSTTVYAGAIKVNDTIFFDGSSWSVFDTPAGSGDVQDVYQNGASVVSNGIAYVVTPEDLADLNTDATHRVVTDVQIAAWNAKQSAISDLDTIRSNASAGKTASDNLAGHTVAKNVPADAIFTDTIYDDTALKARVSTIEGKEAGWDAKADVSDIPTTLAELSGDSTHRTVTDTEKSTWNSKLGDAPSDNKQYARKNGAWSEVEGGEPSAYIKSAAVSQDGNTLTLTKEDDTTVEFSPVAEVSDGHSPYIGQNGHWFEWDATTEQYVDTGVAAQGPQGNTGSSVDYPFELVNNLTTDDATKALSAAMGVRLNMVADSGNDADLDVSDEDGNVILRCENGHIKTKYFDSENIKTEKEISILFFGNSLTLGAVKCLPFVLRTICPELRYRIYCWYNAGATLAQQFTKLQNDTACEKLLVCENAAGWTVYDNTKNISWVLSNCSFDTLCLQEYSYYDITDAQLESSFNNVVGYFFEHYTKDLKVVTLLDDPNRSNVEAMYKRAIKYQQYYRGENISEATIATGSAVYYALKEYSINTLGDVGGLSYDGIHVQSGLPTLMLSEVIALWIFDQLGLNLSIFDKRLKMTADEWLSLGLDIVGSAVIAGTDEQNRVAQECAIKAYKCGVNIINAECKDSGNDADFDLADPDGNVLMRLKNGHIKTKYFDSENSQPITIKPSAEIYVAASNSTQNDKNLADIICSGSADNVIIQNIIDTTTGDIRITLLPGTYQFTPNITNGDSITCILFRRANRTIEITGTIEHDTINANGKTIIEINQSVFNSLNSSGKYTIMSGVRAMPVSPSYIGTHVVIRALLFKIYDCTKSIICLDGFYLGAFSVTDCGFVTTNQFTLNYASVITNYNTGCIAVRLQAGAGNGKSILARCTANGFYIGFSISGEHIIAYSVGAIRCCYGFWFQGFTQDEATGDSKVSIHKITCYSISDEACQNFPFFDKNPYKQSILISNYHSEIYTTQFAQGGNYAKEAVAGQWRGTLTYEIDTIIEGSRVNEVGAKMIEDGYLQGMVCRNLAQTQAATTSERNSWYPTYMQQVYDLTLNKLLICKDTANKTWVDVNGNNQ